MRLEAREGARKLGGRRDACRERRLDLWGQGVRVNPNTVSIDFNRLPDGFLFRS